MEIYKTLLAVEGDNFLSVCDTIEYQGALWLVPEWIAAPHEGWRRPKRLIRLDCPQAVVFYDPKNEVDLLLQGIMPKAVILGPGLPRQDAGFVVIHKPEGPVFPDILH